MTSTWQSLDPETLLPHAGEMVWVHAVRHYEADVCETRTELEKLRRLKQPDGRLPAWAGIEIMAQTAAVHAGIRRREEKKPPQPGFLVSTRRYNCHATFFPAGGRLNTRVEREFGSDTGMCVLTCRIEDADRQKVLADARINVYVPPPEAHPDPPDAP